MVKLKLATIEDDKPVKLSIELPGQVYRDLVAYADLLKREAAREVEPARLIAPMLARFMATDREFVRQRRSATPQNDVLRDS